MFLRDAHELLGQLLKPLPLAQFSDLLKGATAHKIAGDPDPAKINLLGGKPTDLLLGGYAHLAEKLTFHSAEPSGPPPPIGPAANEAIFRARIAQFHTRGYSVRFPELRPLSADLDRMARALEIVLHQPVSASAFWSRGGLRAPVHYDEHDIIAVQLVGEKRWHLSQGPSPLCNGWKTIPGPLPTLGEHVSVTMAPGDVLYVPRGLPHTVDAEGESLHLALGFTPLTARDAIIAVLDQLSESDRAYRDTIAGQLALCLANDQERSLIPKVGAAVARLHEACLSPSYFGAALQRRSARIIGAMAPLKAPRVQPPIGPETVLAPGRLAFCHLTANTETIDFSYPGGHLYIHRAAQESLGFMINTAEFKVCDIPGAIENELKLALASKLLEVGYLEIVSSARSAADPRRG